jgi:uncharacterized protein YbcI
MAEQQDAAQQEAPRHFAKEIVREMVQLYSRRLGRGPTKARIIANTNAIMVIFEDGLTRAEQTLLTAGDADQVMRNRQRVTEAMREESTAIIESLTSRTVTAYLTGLDAKANVSATMFLLDSQPETGTVEVAEEELTGKEVEGDGSSRAARSGSSDAPGSAAAP